MRFGSRDAPPPGEAVSADAGKSGSREREDISGESGYLTTTVVIGPLS
jgi:hypothetical protein